MIPEIYKKALLEELESQELVNMQTAIANSTFYAAGINTVCGGISLGLIEAEEIDIPCLFSTIEKAQDSIDDEVERYIEEVSASEREEDDVFEGEIHLVRWSDDGLNIHIYDKTGSNLLETKTPESAAGG